MHRFSMPAPLPTIVCPLPHSMPVRTHSMPGARGSDTGHKALCPVSLGARHSQQRVSGVSHPSTTKVFSLQRVMRRRTGGVCIRLVVVATKRGGACDSLLQRRRM